MSCCVRHCKNIKRLMHPNSNISFHRIPKAEFAKYMTHLGLVHKNHTAKYICSEHFEKEDFVISAKNRAFLKKGVLPTLKLLPELPTQRMFEGNSAIATAESIYTSYGLAKVFHSYSMTPSKIEKRLANTNKKVIEKTMEVLFLPEVVGGLKKEKLSSYQTENCHDRCRSAVGQEENMSLDTLLEAARYLELQELKEQQQREALVTPVPTQPPPLQPQSLTIIKHVQDPPIPLQPQPQPVIHNQRIIQNSFDIINPLVIDEGGEHKRKQPPLVFRSGTREVHNKLEKHRRAHLKECFDFLKKQLPAQADEKKTSNLSILHSALRFIQSLKRRERDLEHEMERLAREKISAQQRLAVLKKEIAVQCDNVDALLSEQLPTPVITSSETKLVTAPNNVTIAAERIKPNGIKENVVVAQQQQVQTAALSVVPMTGYPVSQGIVLHKLALVPKGIGDLSPLTAVSSPVAHFIAAPTQQLNGKVLPVVNAQYVMKPVVVVSSQPSVAPRSS